MNPKVSVIVPVWGVEKYIEKCARSLFDQSLDDIEFIFVDDCTPDQSIIILNHVLLDYPNRKQQTRIVAHSKNMGLPQARKTGVDAANGEFVIFCDSDDYVENEMYAQLYEYAINKNCDLVHCDIDVVNDDGIVKTLSSSEQLSSEQLKRRIIDGDISNSLCNKLVRRLIYQNVVFPQYGMNEDNAVAIQIAYYAEKLGYIKHSYYKAYQNNASMSRAIGEEQQTRKFIESLENSKYMVDFLLTKGCESNSKSVLRAKMRPKIVLFPLLNKTKYLKLWRKTYPEVNGMAVFDKRLPLGVRIKSLLAITYLFPLFYKYVIK